MEFNEIILQDQKKHNCNMMHNFPVIVTMHGDILVYYKIKSIGQVFKQDEA